MGHKSTFERFDLLSLVCDERRPAPCGGPAALAVQADQRSAAPLRQLHGRGDLGFLDGLADELSEQGLGVEAATGVLVEVVNRPALAVRRAVEGHTTVLQAIVLAGDPADPSDPGGPRLVEVTARVEPGKPSTVHDPAVVAWPLGGEPADAAVEVAESMETWWAEYAVRPPRVRHPASPSSIALYGDLRRSGYLAVPDDWERVVRTAAAVLGASVPPTLTPEQARGAEHGRVPDLALLLRGDEERWKPVRDRVLGAGGVLVDVGQPGTTFAELTAVLRREMVAHTLDRARPEPSATSRELEPGEIVYHRKTRNSDGGFDVFDDGSHDPCQHGVGSYERWRKSDKAAKGMARRYTNFDRKMLHHCRQCSVYMVAYPDRRTDG